MKHSEFADRVGVDLLTPFEMLKESAATGNISGIVLNSDNSVSEIGVPSEDLIHCFSQAEEFNASLHYVADSNGSYTVTYS